MQPTNTAEQLPTTPPTSVPMGAPATLPTPANNNNIIANDNEHIPPLVSSPHTKGIDPITAIAFPEVPLIAGMNEPQHSHSIQPVVTTPFGAYTPPHTHTEATLSPTSEFARYLLTAWGARYLPRGIFHTALEEANTESSGLFGNARKSINTFLGRPGDWLQNKFSGSSRASKIALAYNATLGLASFALTADYSWLVYKDIKNMYSEAVGAEFNKPADQVTLSDIRHSDNKIVQRTMHNFTRKMLERTAVDAMFVPATWLRSIGLGDIALGTKALQLFMETWKRKTTMFEDLVAFVNNKINPRNGLGQPIVVGEIFDLYQHYAQEFHPDQAFTNVLERTTGEGARWATSEPIFRRLTELMNQTYAYKHPSIIDPKTGQAISQANFPLPSFIYLLGHDLIDLRNPERTQVTIEVANHSGIAGVKEMQALVAAGRPLPEIMQQFGVNIPTPTQATTTAAEAKNGVIIKGSSVQLDHAPSTHISADTTIHHPPMQERSPHIV